MLFRFSAGHLLDERPGVASLVPKRRPGLFFFVNKALDILGLGRRLSLEAE